MGVISNGSWSPNNALNINNRSPVSSSLKTAHNHVIQQHTKSHLDIKSRFQELRNYNSSSKLGYTQKSGGDREQNTSYTFNNSHKYLNSNSPQTFSTKPHRLKSLNTKERKKITVEKTQEFEKKLTKLTRDTLCNSTNQVNNNNNV